MNLDTKLLDNLKRILQENNQSEDLSKLLILEREILHLSDETNDEGTNSMMSDFIAEQEKTIWMLNSWLGK